jgi:hypothetical protein
VIYKAVTNLPPLCTPRLTHPFARPPLALLLLLLLLPLLNEILYPALIPSNVIFLSAHLLPPPMKITNSNFNV